MTDQTTITIEQIQQADEVAQAAFYAYQEARETARKMRDQYAAQRVSQFKVGDVIKYRVNDQYGKFRHCRVLAIKVSDETVYVTGAIVNSKGVAGARAMCFPFFDAKQAYSFVEVVFPAPAPAVVLKQENA